ncbi:hypothetical protein BGW38_000710 [Lunasporangiospora selenospora]|uniref:ACB domain-containing protein n=1 Tax=Lunasporangiospora selenospora TaxID=979761 RepID=A0A9P6FUH0_9FUNG|nr:hypothetical protein BGW38_000710 [Lunasporangiospora selenospora]
MLKDRFTSASSYLAASRHLSLPSSTKLALYADFKLATDGLCTQPRPSLIEFEKSAKWKAWKETGEKYTQELNNSASDMDLQTKAMISYIQRVEEGQWGWKFDPSLSAGPKESLGDGDLDELQAYLGIDKEEISAEELLARPYVPNQDLLGGATITASGISTMAREEDEADLGDDLFQEVKSGSVESLRTAIEANPDLVTLKDNMGTTSLHWACDGGNLEKVQLLVETFKADVNAQDNEGSTPLHFAYLSEWPEIISYLKTVPTIDVTIKDESGQKAEDYA